MVYSIYVFLDSNNRPYYVGKTNNMVRRRSEHMEEILGNSRLPKYIKTRQLMQKGMKFRMRRIRTAKTEEEAYRLERYYIRKFRRMQYQLMNCTRGGPLELPMRINKPKNPNPKGILLPSGKKKSKSKKIKNKKAKRR